MERFEQNQSKKIFVINKKNEEGEEDRDEWSIHMMLHMVETFGWNIEDSDTIRYIISSHCDRVWKSVDRFVREWATKKKFCNKKNK